MRNALEQLIRATIVYKYSLPNEGGLSSTRLSTIDDDCFEANSENEISEIIYNAIIEYSFNEFEIENSWEALHARALHTRIRFDQTAPAHQQMKYGFFGEVLLYSVLHIIYNAPTLISRGHFYLPGENSETKGYDSYHLLETGGRVQLWFGEVKFYQSYSEAIRSAMGSIENAISDDYLNRRNMVAIFDKISSNRDYGDSPLTPIIERWKDNPNIDLIGELRNGTFELIYPVFIIANHNKGSYDESVESWVDYIDDNFGTLTFPNITIPYTIFFIFLPVESAGDIKSRVLQWINSNRQFL